MNIHKLIDQYIDFCHSLGELCDRKARHLQSFGRRFNSSMDVADISTEDINAFLFTCREITNTWHNKHSALAGLFRYAISREYITITPLSNIIPKRPPAFIPYIYSRDELRCLLDATNSYQRHRSTMEPVTLRTILMILYGAGLRMGEALTLRRADVDFKKSLIMIHHAKFFKTRLVPIGSVLVSTLRKYSTRQPLNAEINNDSTFFTMRTGEPVKENTLQCSFRRLCNHAGIRRSDAAKYEPRLQDLRHSFAVHRLISWYKQGMDVQLQLPHLSVYMGHVSIASTQVYLKMTTELLQEASMRFELYALNEEHENEE